MAINDTLAGAFLQNGHVASQAIVYDSGATQDPILLPIRSNVGVQVSFDVAGSASIEGTLSPHDAVRADAATWAAWPEGEVSATNQQVCHGLTAIRVLRVSGTVRVVITIMQ